MKRTKVIALVLCAAIMLMGAGYAAWNETLTITNNVATGNLSVALANGTVAVTTDTFAHPGTGAVAATTGEKNTATVTLTNLYPGAHVTVSIPVTNDGSIPVKLGQVGNTENTDWLTLSNVVAPAELAVNASGEITFVVDIPLTGVDVPEGGNASFTVTADYVQFNN